MFESPLDLLDDLRAKHASDESLKDFFNFAATLPPSLQFTTIRCRPTHPSNARNMREAFSQFSFKRDMYRWFAQHYGDELFAMNVSLMEIDRMRDTGRRPRTRDKQPLDFTIDHIRSLRFGGDNKFSNLCFLPGQFNHFKNVLEKLQVETGEPVIDQVLVTIEPRKVMGRLNRVPFIEGGYKARIANAGIG